MYFPMFIDLIEENFSGIEGGSGDTSPEKNGDKTENFQPDQSGGRRQAAIMPKIVRRLRRGEVQLTESHP
jgi:hypothetical protein